VRRRPLLLILGASLALLGAGAAVGGLRRRVQLVALYGSGAIHDVTWPDIARMLPPASGYNIEALLASRSPYASISNPFSTHADRVAGQALFETQCAICHGRNGVGGEGPDLTRGLLRHGESDWALYRTITLGVPGSAMQAQTMPAKDRWQLVAYLRSIARASHADLAAPTADSGVKLAPEDPSITTLRAIAQRTVGAVPGSAPPGPEVTFDQLRAARHDSAGWLTYSGAYDGQRHSLLSQINRANVKHLKLAWLVPLATTEKVETSPLVVGTTMYLTVPPSDAWAIDARTGAALWSYLRPIPNDLRICCGRQNRGLAVLGETLYLGTMDGHLVALSARTGQVLWDTEVADYRSGYSITGAPLAVDGQIITGVGGGEFAIQGFLDSYDSRTGRRLWRFRTIPGPGEPGHDTWGGDSWKLGGGPTWMTGAYDPELGLLYWGTGNPGPDFQGSVRPGDNLYTNSMVALDVHTGQLRWYYQFTPHDEHDWDATQVPVLAEASIRGVPRRLVLQANRNGFYYVLDRETGAFITARPFVHQTWADGFDSLGHPRIRPDASPSTEGTLVNPGASGGTNWWPPSYDPAQKLFFVQTKHAAGMFFSTPVVEHVPGGAFLGSAGQPLADLPGFSTVQALDAATGAQRWQFRPPEGESRSRAGLLSTAGGLVFVGGVRAFYALDASTGAVLWSIDTGAEILAAPMTYLIDGRQFVTIAAGNAILSFSLDGH
jgi:alcohol dehydrogenase (cytochrome c)